jgi:hypothetical protein
LHKTSVAENEFSATLAGVETGHYTTVLIRMPEGPVVYISNLSFISPNI